jgi:hypothetical protein
MAHYNPFAFPVNKKSITKSPHYTGKSEGDFREKLPALGGIHQSFFQYFKSTKKQLIAKFFNHLAFLLSLTP